MRYEKRRWGLVRNMGWFLVITNIPLKSRRSVLRMRERIKQLETDPKYQVHDRPSMIVARLCSSEIASAFILRDANLVFRRQIGRGRSWARLGFLEFVDYRGGPNCSSNVIRNGCQAWRGHRGCFEPSLLKSGSFRFLQAKFRGIPPCFHYLGSVNSIFECATYLSTN